MIGEYCDSCDMSLDLYGLHVLAVERTTDLIIVKVEPSAKDLLDRAAGALLGLARSSEPG